TSPEDEWTRTLAVVERELDAAQATLDEWIGIPEEQRRRLEKLRQAWAAQTERLLARPEFAGVEAEPSPGATPRVRQRWLRLDAREFRPGQQAIHLAQAL